MKDAALGHCAEARQAVEDQRRGPASDRSANSSIDSFVKGCGVRQAVPALRRLHGSDEGALLGEPQPVLPPRRQVPSISTRTESWRGCSRTRLNAMILCFRARAVGREPPSCRMNSNAATLFSPASAMHGQEPRPALQFARQLDYWMTECGPVSIPQQRRGIPTFRLLYSSS